MHRADGDLYYSLNRHSGFERLILRWLFSPTDLKSGMDNDTGKHNVATLSALQ